MDENTAYLELVARLREVPMKEQDAKEIAVAISWFIDTKINHATT